MLRELRFGDDASAKTASHFERLQDDQLRYVPSHLARVGTVPTVRTFNRIGQALANGLKPCELVEREELFRCNDLFLAGVTDAT